MKSLVNYKVTPPRRGDTANAPENEHCHLTDAGCARAISEDVYSRLAKPRRTRAVAENVKAHLTDASDSCTVAEDVDSRLAYRCVARAISEDVNRKLAYSIFICHRLHRDLRPSVYRVYGSGRPGDTAVWIECDRAL